jgi:hypothetical protein
MSRRAEKERAMQPAEQWAEESMTPGAGRRAPRAWLPIALGIVAGLAICVVVALALRFANQPAPDPAPTARAICSDLSSQRYKSLYDLLTPNLQMQGTLSQFVASQRELDRLLGPVRACQVSGASASGASADVILTLQRTRATTAHAALSQTSGGWRIASYDQTV